MLGVLDDRNRFIQSALIDLFGRDAMLGDDDDWKKDVTEQFISECLEDLLDSTSFCNPDARSFGICYWNKMFRACPVKLGGGNCE